MKYIKTILLAILLLCFVAMKAQSDKVKGSISTSDTVDLSILNIYPESFPNVSVVFKAEKRSGEPVWDLTKEKMNVKENTKECEVVSLEKISRIKPIDLGIVIDHSGSMEYDMSQVFNVDKDGAQLFTVDSTGKIILSKYYVPPIDNAKAAVKKFVSSFNAKKDFISVVGFSSRVDKILPLTQKVNEINSVVEGMQADSSTALYDAMISGIEQIKQSNGIKVLVVLTDGQDNSSNFKSKNVIDKANENNIPIYMIGLGDVNADTLKYIAKSTKGQFYYAKSSTSLENIYDLISKQVQAFYNLVYTSTNLSSLDTTRQIELSFDIDSTYLISNTGTLNLPKEVVAFVEKKEKEKEYLLYGGTGLAVLIATGTLLFYFRRKKKKQPVIKKLFPNPSDGFINLDFESPPSQLQIINLNGQTEITIEINGSEKQFDLSTLRDGNYISIIIAGGQQSNAVKFIIKR